MLSLIESGFFSFGEPERFRRILDQLRYSDPYMVCADFEDYVATEARAAEVYRDPLDWSRRAVFNIAGASRFSSDETIRQYASEIWGLQPVAVELGDLADSGSVTERDRPEYDQVVGKRWVTPLSPAHFATNNLQIAVAGRNAGLGKLWMCR